MPPSLAMQGVLQALRLRQGSKAPSFADLIYPVHSFAGGLNSKSSLLFFDKQARYALKPNQMTRCENLIRTPSGGLVTRPGRTRLNTTAISPPAGNNTIRDFFELRLSTGTSRLLCHAGNTIYRWDDPNWVSIGTVITANTRIHWCQLGDTGVGFDGTNDPISTDGLTISALGGSPPISATVCVSFRRRVFALAGQTLYHCALGNVNNWTAVNDAGSVPLPVTQGRSGTAFLPFWDRLIVLSDYEAFQLVGSSPSVWQMMPINWKYGHQGSPYGAFFAGNDGYYVSAKGVHSLSTTLARSETGDVAWDYESGNIEPDWLDITAANLGNIVGVQDTLRNLFIILCNTNGTTNNEAFVGDYYHLDDFGKPTWTRYSNMPFASAAEVYSLGSGVPRVIFGGYDGIVYQQDATIATDANSSGGAVNVPTLFQYVTDLDVPGWSKTFRRMVIYAQAASGNLVSNTSFDFGLRVLTNTTDLSQSTGDRIGETFTIGTSPLGTLNFIPHEVPIPGHGRILVLNVTYTSSVRLTLGGIIFYAGLRRVLTGRV